MRWRAETELSERWRATPLSVTQHTSGAERVWGQSVAATAGVMIHRFEDLKQLYKEATAIRYVGGGTAADAEVDFPDATDSQDELFASATPDEMVQALGSAPGLSAPEPAPAEEAPSATEPNPYLDFDLAPGDIAKLQNYGVRPKDAVDAGFTRVTSSESAFYLNRRSEEHTSE